MPSSSRSQRPVVASTTSCSTASRRAICRARMPGPGHAGSQRVGGDDGDAAAATGPLGGAAAPAAPPRTGSARRARAPPSAPRTRGPAGSSSPSPRRRPRWSRRRRPAASPRGLGRVRRPRRPRRGWCRRAPRPARGRSARRSSVADAAHGHPAGAGPSAAHPVAAEPHPPPEVEGLQVALRRLVEAADGVEGAVAHHARRRARTNSSRAPAGWPPGDHPTRPVEASARSRAIASATKPSGRSVPARTNDQVVVPLDGGGEVPGVGRGRRPDPTTSRSRPSTRERRAGRPASGAGSAGPSTTMASGSPAERHHQAHRAAAAADGASRTPPPVERDQAAQRSPAACPARRRSAGRGGGGRTRAAPRRR